jgi:Rieske Fe-S protein
MGGPPGDGDKAFASAGRFNCPCHGSIYNRYGQIVQGPAPRPMDRFPIAISGGKITVQTGPDKAISRSVAAPSDATPAA